MIALLDLVLPFTALLHMFTSLGLSKSQLFQLPSYHAPFSFALACWHPPGFHSQLLPPPPSISATSSTPKGLNYHLYGGDSITTVHSQIHPLCCVLQLQLSFRPLPWDVLPPQSAHSFLLQHLPSQSPLTTPVSVFCLPGPSPQYYL